MNVQVLPHDPAWRAQFEAQAVVIQRTLGDALVAVHHIGSTAVAGLAAKPIVDMLLEVTSLTALDACTALLSAQGFEALGEFGIAGRRYFRLHDAQGLRTHHVHAFVANSDHALRHLAFRDYLRAHPQAVAEYGALKLQLAQRHPNEMDAYMDGKDAFVQQLQALALTWAGTAKQALVQPQVYWVGGAVRDALMGLPVHDRDFVVVGSSPEAMLAEGFLPVGKDFPVFLHPLTHDEVALARTERKTAAGYHGFAFHAAPTVRIEADLARRDLTINSIAIDVINTLTPGQNRIKNSVFELVQAAQGADLAALPRADRLIDPFNGVADIQNRVLRHVTDAFAEDPVRILRVARFAARFVDFSIAPSTQQLMARMVQNGEVAALVPERVWQELSRGLMAAKPSRMLQILHDCGALAVLLPELALTDDVAHAVDESSVLDLSLEQRYARLFFEANPQAVSERLRVPTPCKAMAQLLFDAHADIAKNQQLPAEGLLALLTRCDALRRPERFAQLLQACNPAGGVTRLQTSLAAAAQIDATQIAKQASAAQADIGKSIHEARADAIRHALANPQ